MEHAFWVVLVGASGGHFLWQILHRAMISPMVLENRIEEGPRAELLLWGGLGAILLAGAVAIWYRVRGSADSLTVLVARLRLGVPLFLVPALSLKSLWRAEPLLMMLALIAALAFLYWALCDLAPRWSGWWQSVPTKAWVIISGLLILSYFLYFAYYTVLNHYQLGTYAYDLGVFENTFMQTLHGNFLENAEYGHRSFFSRHFSPILALWFPFYALLPRPETLLILQSALVALAGIPLFLLGRTILRSDALAALIVLCYLIHPANHGPNFYDVHEMAFFPVAVLTLFYFFETHNKVAYFVTLVLVLSVKEDIALLVVPIAVFFALENRPRLAWITVAICAVWYLGAGQIIVASGGRAEMFDFYYEDMLLGPDEGAAGVIKTVLANPLYTLEILFTKERLLYLLQLLVPLMGLPLLRFRTLLLVVYGFAVTLLSTRSELHNIAFQYTWYVLPLLFVGLIYVLREVRSTGPRAVSPIRWIQTRPVVVTLLVASLAVSWQYGAILSRRGFVGGLTNVDFSLDETERLRLVNLRSMARLIPESASVCASEALVPHLPIRNRRALWRHPRFVPDYVVIFKQDTWMLQNRGLLQRYTLEDEAHGIQLLRRVR